MKQTPSVGVGAVILNQSQEVLLLLRKRSPEKKHWSLPGGKVEWLETIEQATLREIYEETNLTIQLERLLCVTNQILPAENSHFVCPTYLVTTFTGQLLNKEPEKADKLGWFSLKELPSPLTLPTLNALTHL